MIPPVQIMTVNDEQPQKGIAKALVVNRATRSDDNVVISFDDKTGSREAFGLTPDAAIEFAMALLNAAQEVRAGR